MEILRVDHGRKSAVLAVHFRALPARPGGYISGVGRTRLTCSTPAMNLLRPYPPLSTPWAWLGQLALWAAILAWAPAMATPAPGLELPLQSLAQNWAAEHLKADTGATDKGTALRPELVIGQLDTRLQLAPCAKIEPYLPRGSRLWGRSRIGLRCVDGPTAWNVFLPVTVKVWGPAWIVTRPVAPGEVIGAGDAQPGEVDWAEHPAPVLTQQSDWVGVTAARGLMPGQVLRQSMVRPVQVFNAGTEVKVVVTQARFNLSASGRAMSHGFVGQPVRVKLGSGKVVSGRVKRDATVSVDM